MKKHSNTIILSIAFLLGLILTVSTLQAMSIFRTRAQAPIPGTVIIPQTPAPKPTQSSIQLETFPYITLTPTPTIPSTNDPVSEEEQVSETKDPDLKTNDPGTGRPIDPGVVGAGGLIFPSTMTPHPSKSGYFQLPFPRSPDGSYRSYTCAGKSWGSRELIGVINTVAIKWKEKYPNGWINVGDLTAGPGHASHKKGVDVDLDATTNGRDLAADYTKSNPYNRQATIELGIMFAQTGKIKVIFYNDPAVNKAVLAANTNSKGMQMYPWPNHENHFHVRINTPSLAHWGAGC